jgi:hypothetical protein
MLLKIPPHTHTHTKKGSPLHTSVLGDVNVVRRPANVVYDSEEAFELTGRHECVFQVSVIHAVSIKVLA